MPPAGSWASNWMNRQETIPIILDRLGPHSRVEEMRQTTDGDNCGKLFHDLTAFFGFDGAYYANLRQSLAFPPSRLRA